MPRLIVSDRAPRMTGLFWRALWHNLHLTLRFSSSYHPQTDGQSEIVNSAVLDLLKCYASDNPAQWEHFLPLVEFAYNNTIHSSTGKALFEIVEGARKPPPMVKVMDDVFEADKFVENLGLVYQELQQVIQKAQEKQKKAADKHRRRLHFREGDWFQSTFQVLSDKSSTSFAREDLVPLLLDTLQKQAGSSEEVAALSVSLLRALGVTARYVTVLDVISLKPDSSSLEASSADWDAFKVDNGSFLQQALSTKIASSLGQAFSPCAPQTLAMAITNTSASPTIGSTNSSRRRSLEGRGQQMTGEMKRIGKQMVEDSGSKSQKRRKKIEFERTNDLQVSTKDHGSDGGSNIAIDLPGSEKKKKGDLEFELQLAMAMAATAGTAGESDGKVAQKLITKNDLSSSLEAKSPSNLEKEKSLHENTARPVASGSAVWSRKLGPLLNWAEVFCVEKDSGKWVHVDAGRGLLDGAELVEEAARSYRVPLRYVLAFAGNGAKDVTRRYVTLWSAVAPLRVSNDWWNVTLAPLKELEAAGTSLDLKEEGGTGFVEKIVGAGLSSSKVWTSSRQIKANDRSSLEDMELDIREHTEPLPKNQQAYKNHHLYALERWLTKYQGLHPRGPILGYCAGHPVFPRACVQDLHTAERWLREGLKVRPHEVPAKGPKSAVTTAPPAVH
ncbi:hypothetical protein L7F22_068370 [Adiantum nelumboides]|nr:hypothetical protein [Adiantum nelumboides]